MATFSETTIDGAGHPAPMSIRVPTAPPLRPADGGGLLLAAPALGGLGSVGLVAFSALGGSGAMRTRGLLAAGLFLTVTIAFVVLQVERQRRQRQLHHGMTRDDHHAHLRRARRAVSEAAARQRADALARHPGPVGLLTAASHRSDDMEVRIGCAALPLALRLEVPEPSPGQPGDPASQRAVERFAQTFRTVPDLPATLDLRATTDLVMTGDTESCHALLRAMICSAAHGHSPDVLRIAVVGAPGATAACDWLKWLPHHGSPAQDDAVGPVRLATETASALELLLAGRAHLLLVDLRTGPVEQIRHPSLTRIRIAKSGGGGGSSEASTVRLTVEDESATLQTRRSPAVMFRPDRAGASHAAAIARRLAQTAPSTTPDSDLTTLLRHRREPFTVPLGRDDDGRAVVLDLREAAAGGHGPHGLVIGATGSGKSELLRTVVTGLALTRSPDELHLVLVDFKGGATFAGLAELAHTAGFVTNLAGDAAQIDRTYDVLTGELLRRQRVLLDAGAERIDDLEPGVLPRLLVVVDEFTELLTARPDFAELFAGIGRVGRSLGVHLLLASQRLDEGRLRGLEAHLGFRIALRTFSATESRSVIGVADAHQLPRLPGHALLRTGPDELIRFRSCLVSRPVRQVEWTHPLAYTASPVTEPPSRDVELPSLLERTVAAVNVRAGEGRRARRIWLPPLTSSASLPDLLAARPDAGHEALPIGLVDLPAEHRHGVLTLDLTGGRGHVGVVGGPRSGRSTLLKTIAHALSAGAGLYELVILDLGGDLDDLRSLPGTTRFVPRNDPDALPGAVRHLRDELELRRAAGTPHPARGPRPSVWIIVDGWTTLRERAPSVEAELVALAHESLAVDIHLVLTASRWTDLRPALRDAIGTRLELRLGDPLDSLHGRHLAQRVRDAPGHGLSPDGQHFLAALPMLSDPAAPT